MAQSKHCPKCNGTMVEGFTIDQTYGSMAVPSWVEGAPERSVWTGVKLGGKAKLDVATWRCRSCGFLEHYATGARGQEQAKKQAERAALIVVGLLVGLLAALAGVLALVLR